jgi:hypothetical protein
LKQKVEAEYQAWLKEVESKLDDTAKSAWQTLTGSPVAQELFGGHLREADYYRKLNDVTEQKRAAEAEKSRLEQEKAALDRDVQSVDEWFKREQPKNQRLVAEREALAARLNAAEERLKQYGLEDELPEAPRVQANGRGRDSEDELRQEIDALRRQVTQYDRALPTILADYGQVMTKIAKEGYDVDPAKIIEYTTTNGVKLTQAYDHLVADQRKAKEATERAEELDKVREEARREALSKLPSPGAAFRPIGPSIQEVVKNAEQYSDPQKRVALAVQDFLNGVGR